MRVLPVLVDVLGDLLIQAYRSYSAARANRKLKEEQIPAQLEMDRREVYISQISRDAIDCVEDPCVAATSMMCAIADRGEGLKPTQVKAIQRKIADTFRIRADEAEDILSLARWTRKCAASLDDCLNRLGLVIHKNCSVQEKFQLLELLEYAAGINAPMDESQHHAITRLKYRLGI